MLRNDSHRITNEPWAAWQVASFCWNYLLLVFALSNIGHQKLLIIDRSPGTMEQWRQKYQNEHKTMTFLGCIGHSWISCGFNNLISSFHRWWWWFLDENYDQVPTALDSTIRTLVVNYGCLCIWHSISSFNNMAVINYQKYLLKQGNRIYRLSQQGLLKSYCLDNLGYYSQKRIRIPCLASDVRLGVSFGKALMPLISV